MKIRRLLFSVLILSLSIAFSACSDNSTGMHKGYYSAEAAEFDKYGWKEFVTIYVSDNKITTVEYNARNAGGFIKSWDMDYMRTMNAICGTYPNEYTRAYAVSLLNWQNASDVDVVAGATHSFNSFRMLAEAAIAQAKAGDKKTAMIEIPEAVD